MNNNKNTNKRIIKVVKDRKTDLADLKYQNMINSIVIKNNGKQVPTKRGGPMSKFVDLAQLVSPSNIGSILSGICPIPPGTSASQRTGDTVYWQKLYINYTVATQNVDIFNLVRLIIFQWHPNSALVVPIVTDILQLANIYSMYDWQFANQSTILYDRVHCMSGIAGAPCDSGFQGSFGSVSIGQAVKKAEFAPGLTLGSEQLYILVISDSLLVPFPFLNIQTRVIYTDD
jgi:hypothetical protein